ncbi:MAG: hypothetical protein V4585_06415 [Bacteroidota bacterium]
MKNTILFIFALSVLACQSKKTENSKVKIVEKVNIDTLSSDVKVSESTSKPLSEDEKAKKWLIEKIEENFKNTDGIMESICTKTYAEYKSDATGVDYDGGLTPKAFEKKWKGKFDTKHAGTGTGFLISGQDWTKIKVKKCELSPVKLKETYLFETIIEDVGATTKTIYKRDIKVIPAGGSFLISDVLEY